MRYIATREGVEKLAGNSAVTKGQRELIQKLLYDFPDAVELFASSAILINAEAVPSVGVLQ